MSEQQQPRSGFTRTVTKKAVGPIVASAATAGTAFLIRKGSEVWEERVRPKLEEKGGGKAVASEALDGLRQRLPDAATEKLDAVSSKLSGEGDSGETASPASATTDDREQERRQRQQRRQQRKRALDKAS